MKYLLLINKQIKTTDILNNKDEFQNNYSERKNSERKKPGQKKNLSKILKNAS